jgi:hypothetical protein
MEDGGGLTRFITMSRDDRLNLGVWEPQLCLVAYSHLRPCHNPCIPVPSNRSRRMVLFTTEIETSF